MNRALLIMMTWILSSSLLAQESPTTPIARRLRIIQGPKIELSRENLTIISWVDSTQASGVGDRVTSPLRHFSTRLCR